MLTPMPSNPWTQPLQIGSLRVANRVLLAPLAGVSDAPFRRICQEMGAGLTYVEMLSAPALLHSTRRREPRMERHPAEPMLGVQLTGPSAEAVAQGVAVLDRLPYDTIDLNMGCPVHKIVSRGAGSAILRDPDRVSLMARLAMARTGRPLTAKIRLGFTRDSRNVEEVVRRLAGEGVAMITIHGRTRTDPYGVPADLDAIAAGVAVARADGRPGLVVLGNGDIFDRAGAERMRIHTGCDGVLISRGALGNPWVFRQILAPGTPHPRADEWRDTLVRHLDYHLAHYEGSPLALPTFRKHLLWYAAGFPRMRRAREALTAATNRETVIRIVDGSLQDMDPGLRRYASNQDAGASRLAAEFDPKAEMEREADRALACFP